MELNRKEFWEQLLVDDDALLEPEAYDAEFARIADFLLNGCDLLVCGKERFRLCEVEAYYKGGYHIDPFTHCDARQQNHCAWYFHRSNGKSYKSGTYKGLDVAFGKDKIFAGFLIRSIERLSDGKLYEGPCLTVNAILDIAGVDSVAPFADDLMKGEWQAASTDDAHPLRLVPTESGDPRTDEVHRCMRVGLTLKKQDQKEGRLRFIGAPYRFLTQMTRIKKGSPNIIAALAHEGLDPGEIAAMARRTPKSVKTSYDLYRKGRSEQLAAFVGQSIKTTEYARLYGAYTRYIEENE